MPKCPEGETYDRVEKRCRPKKSPGRKSGKVVEDLKKIVKAPFKIAEKVAEVPLKLVDKVEDALESKPKECVIQHTKKYSERPSPPYPASACCGETKKGNDGEMWTSRLNEKTGVCTWRKK